jgi:hypothetical protein
VIDFLVENSSAAKLLVKHHLMLMLMMCLWTWTWTLDLDEISDADGCQNKDV